MQILLFLVGFTIGWSQIKYSQGWLRDPLGWLALAWIVLFTVPILNLVIGIIIDYYFFLALLLKFEIIEYCEK